MGGNDSPYEFRARGVDKAGNVQPWPDTAQASTRVDAIDPTATVDPLNPLTLLQAFTVSWTASDNSGGSGLKHCDIQYRIDDGPWDDWLKETTATSAQFTGGDHNGRYEFRVRAVDVAGNVQAYSAVAQAYTIVDVEPPTVNVLSFNPPITADDSFTVRWTGQSSANTSIVSYDLQRKIANGSWQQWLSGTTATQSVFTDLQAADSVYCFRVRARDSAERVSAYGGQQCIIVDRFEPFIEPRAYLPSLISDDSPRFSGKSRHRLDVEKH